MKSILTSPLSVKEIKEKAHIDIDTRKLSKMLSEFDFITKEKKNGKNVFRRKTTQIAQTTLF